MKCNFLFLICYMCFSHLLSGQECMGTIRLDDKQVCVLSVLSLDAPVLLGDLHAERQDLPELNLLYRYYHTTSFNAYRSIYRTDDWYGLTEKEYAEWMMYMRDKNLFVESNIRFTHEGTTYAAIQFYLIADGFYDRLTFLCKEINGGWFPGSQKEEEVLAIEKGFFRVIRPQLIEYLFEGKETAMTRSNAKAPQLRQSVMKGKDMNGRALLMDRKSVGSFRSVDYQTLYYNLEERVNPEQWVTEDAEHHAEFQAYMDSLQVSQSKQAEIMQLIADLRYFKAALRIAQYQGSELQMPFHVTAIRRIYGQNRLIEVLAKIETQ